MLFRSGESQVLRLSRNQVIQIIEPHLDSLYRIGAVPFQRYQAEYPNREIHLPRTRACILWDLMVTQARLEFRGIRGTQILDPPSGITLLILEDQIAVRFKKLDEDSLPRNYPTEAAKDWHRGEDLPGIPSSLQRLSMGYRLNRLQAAVENVLISNTLAGRLLYDIILEAPADGAILFDRNRSDSEGIDTQRQQPQRRVRIRPSEEQAEM